MRLKTVKWSKQLRGAAKAGQTLRQPSHIAIILTGEIKYCEWAGSTSLSWHMQMLILFWERSTFPWAFSWWFVRTTCKQHQSEISGGGDVSWFTNRRCTRNTSLMLLCWLLLSAIQFQWSWWWIDHIGMLNMKVNPADNYSPKNTSSWWNSAPLQK